jgi:hypothetical protein
MLFTTEHTEYTEQRIRGRSVSRVVPDNAQIHQRQICFPRFGRESRNDVAEVGFVERGVLVDLSGEKTFAKRTEWNESDSELLERRQQLLFRLSPP